MIDHVGIVPYQLLKPALLNATVEQLRRILDVNPMLVEEADELFHEMVRREFPKYADREPDGWTWRKKYDELIEKKERKESAKLDMLTKRIGQAHSSDQGRKTVGSLMRKLKVMCTIQMVIDMAHTRVKSNSFFTSARDTQIKMLSTPSAIQLSQARKHVKTGEFPLSFNRYSLCGTSHILHSSRRKSQTGLNHAPWWRWPLDIPIQQRLQGRRPQNRPPDGQVPQDAEAVIPQPLFFVITRVFSCVLKI